MGGIAALSPLLGEAARRLTAAAAAKTAPSRASTGSGGSIEAPLDWLTLGNILGTLTRERP